MERKLNKTLLQIRSLAVFANLKKDPVLDKLCCLMEALEADVDPPSCKSNGSCFSPAQLTDLYSQIISSMFPISSDLSEYIRNALLSDDNFYIEAVACGDGVSEEVKSTVEAELKKLEEAASLTSADLLEALGERSVPTRDLPRWTNSSIHLSRDFEGKLRNLSTTGYGIFAGNCFFRISEGEILPVPHPDVQPLSELFGYESPRNQIIRNTEALINGEAASNMLLYGDAGTGKSSTVKAVAFAYADRGLRLIEIKKDQLSLIPRILDQVSRQALKFILYIDDLSFAGQDDNFSTLKATLEGSVSGRSDNMVIYATSNRRHLIRESFSDRNGDELHINDTLQETMSLAARFGMTVMFERPGKDEYLSIVEKLARLNGIDMPTEELYKKAEAHAVRRNGRSPRTARQFIELISTGLVT